MKHNKSLILPFSNIRATDLPLVGGKGANLGEMTHAGFPVPSGFCITTNAFQQFINSYSKAEELYKLLDTVNINSIDSVRKVGELVRKKLLESEIPSEIIDASLEKWREIGDTNAYAIRSSATAEDLPDASFAGQQDTYLNIIGEEAILDAIRRCWVSLFTDRAIFYRIKNNFPHRDVKLSVIVQKMIMSDISGILFTADPLTGHRHTLTIDASLGLGEALVSGLVSPDAYYVDKKTNTILNRKISEKKMAIYPKKEGGTIKVEIDEKLSRQIVLKDSEILALADLGNKIESYYKHPQDIEWAICDEKIYLLQTRPITSLYPIDTLKSPDGNLKIYFSNGHQQSMTRAMSPLGLSLLQTIIPVGHSESKFESSILRISGGRMYTDITFPLRNRVLKKGILNLLSQLDALSPQIVNQVIQRPEFKKNPRTHLPFKFYKEIFKVMKRVYKSIWKRDLKDFNAKTNLMIEQHLNEIRSNFEEKNTVKEKFDLMMEFIPNTMQIFMNWVPEAGAGNAAIRLLTKRAGKWLSADELENLTLGIPGNVVNEMNMAIGDLTDLVRQSEELFQAFSDLGEDANAWLVTIEKLEGSRPFIEAWGEFISLYGVRGPSEIDIQTPRWYEDPMPILLVINEFLRREKEYHISHQAIIVSKREKAIEKLRVMAGNGPFGKRRLRKIERLYSTMINVGGMREHHKFAVIRIIAVYKEIFKEIATHLVSLGILNSVEDIWFLSIDEIDQIWDDRLTDWKTMTNSRKGDLKRYNNLSPPLIITSDGETPVVQYQIEDAPEGALLGNPVSPGVIEGVVHIIRDPVRETITTEEILVAEFTDPGWTPLFINAKGLILEVGGALTHGAVVAREYGIPAIVGVRGATRELHTGQRVRIDGNRGIIEIL